MNELYKQSMDELLEQVDDLSKRLSRPIKDLDDIRVAMAALKELREDEIKIDMTLIPIEVHMCITVCAVCVGVVYLVVFVDVVYLVLFVDVV